MKIKNILSLSFLGPSENSASSSFPFPRSP